MMDMINYNLPDNSVLEKFWRGGGGGRQGRTMAVANMCLQVEVLGASLTGRLSALIIAGLHLAELFWVPSCVVWCRQRADLQRHDCSQHAHETSKREASPRFAGEAGPGEALTCIREDMDETCC